MRPASPGDMGQGSTQVVELATDALTRGYAPPGASVAEGAVVSALYSARIASATVSKSVVIIAASRRPVPPQRVDGAGRARATRGEECRPGSNEIAKDKSNDDSS